MQEEAKEGAGSGGTGRQEGLKSKVDGLAALMRQLKAARAGARRARIGVMLVIVIVVIVYALMMISAGKKFVDNEVPKLVAQANQRAIRLAADARQDLMAMAERVGPIYLEEVRGQLRTEAWPRIQAQLQSEGEALLGDLQEYSESTLASRVPALAERQQDQVAEAFKELMDDETRGIVMDNLETALRDAALKVFEERIGEAEARLRKTHEKILTFLPEGEREPFKQRMHKVWDTILLDELKGREMIEE